MDEMLLKGEVPSEDQLLPREFREKFNPGKIYQLGLVVPSVTEAATRLEKAGLGPFFIAEDDLESWEERGEIKSFHGKMGIAFLGGYELELLEGGRGSAFYSDHVREDGKIALQHLGILDHNVDVRIKEFNDGGIETFVRGKIKLGPMTVDFAYMDSRKEAGLIVEFIDYRMFGRPSKPAKGMMKFGAKVMKRLGKDGLKMGKV